MKKEPTTPAAKYTYAMGRRKTSIATVRLFVGKGENEINGRKAELAINDKLLLARLNDPFKVTDNEKKYYFTAKITGGGKTSQIESLLLAISKALVEINPEDKKVLRANNLMTRDPRMVERKKIGLRKARKAPQYSKR